MFAAKIVHQQRNTSQLNARQTNWRPIPMRFTSRTHRAHTNTHTESHSNSPQAVAVVAKRQK